MSTKSAKNHPAGVTVFRRGKSFAYNVELPSDPLTSERRREYGGGFATDDEAWAAALKVKASVDANHHVPKSKRKVSQFFDEWLASIAESVKHSTEVNYADYCKAYVTPIIGKRQLRDVTVKTLNTFYQHLLKEGRRKKDMNSVMYDYWKTRMAAGVDPRPADIAAYCGVGIHAARAAVLRYRRGRVPTAKSPGLAPKTVKNIHRMLHRAFDDAVAWQYIDHNPARHARLPRQRRRRMKTGATWTPEQLAAWLRVAAHDRDAAMWVLVSTTGMRRSELAGAERRLLDLDRGTLTKEDTWIVVAGHAEASDGKTDSSNHTISLDPITVEYLTRHVAQLDQERRDFGDSYHDHGRLFCHPDGMPIHPDTITRRFNRLVDQAGVPRIRLHDVRHTYATVALDNGVPLKIVSERLGHASMVVTSQIYTHKSVGNDADAARDMANLIFKNVHRA